VGEDEIFADYLNAAANDVIQSGFVEGNRVKKTHLVIERNNRLRQAYFHTHPSPHCDVCSLDTRATYPWANRILDLHHLLPLSSGIQVKKSSTTFDDLVPVCPSCHRAIRRFYDQWLCREGLEDFPNETQARVVYRDLKAGFRGAVHA
jgi:predicted HNH restriction endonuclease